MCHHCEFKDLARAGVEATMTSAKEAVAKGDSPERAAFRMNMAAALAYAPPQSAHTAEVAAAEENGAKAIAEQIGEHRVEMPFSDTPSFISGLSYGVTLGLRQGYALMGVAEARAIRKVLGGHDDEAGIHGTGPTLDRSGRSGT